MLLSTHHASNSDLSFTLLDTDFAHSLHNSVLCSSGMLVMASMAANPASHLSARPRFALSLARNGFQFSKHSGNSLSVRNPPRPSIENISLGAGAARSLAAMVGGIMTAPQNGGA